MKKRVFSLFLVLCMVISTIPVFSAGVSAAEIEKEGNCGPEAKYTLYDNGELEISGTGPMDDWGVYPDFPPFEGEYIVSLTVKPGITSVGNYAFSYCTDIEEISLPEGLEKIGERAFLGCEFTDIKLPESVSEIGKSAFSTCTYLSSIELPSNLKSVSEEAFSYCTRLESVNLHDGITEIGPNAFKNCDSLKQICIPASVTTVDATAFKDCDSLEIIDVDEKNKSYTSVDGVLYSADKGRLCIYPYNKQDEVYKVANKTTEMSDAIFAYNKNIKEVDLPDGLKVLPEEAFYKCTSLEKVGINKNSCIYELGCSVFEGCENLREIYIPRNVNALSWNWISGCSSLKSIKVDEENYNLRSKDGVVFSTTYDTLYAYPDAHPGEEYSIPEGTTGIDQQAFGRSKYLKVINLPKSLTSDSRELTAYRFPVLEKVNVASGNTDFSSEGGVLYNGDKSMILLYPLMKNNEVLDIPDSVKEIRSGAFAGLVYYLPDDFDYKYKTINIGAGFDPSYLGKINLSQVAAINVSAENENMSSENGVVYNKNKDCLYFYPVDKPDEVLTIPDSVTEIYKNAFYIQPGMNKNPENIVYNYKTVNIGEKLDTVSNINLKHVKEINVAEKNGNYSSYDGVLFNKDKTVLLNYPAAKDSREFNIPDSVTDIECCIDGAPGKLKKLNIGAGLENDYCLSKIKIGNLSEISVSPENPTFSSENNILMNKNGDIIYGIAAGTENGMVKIPDSVEYNYAYIDDVSPSVNKLHLGSRFYIDAYAYDAERFPWLTEISVSENNLYMSSKNGLLLNDFGDTLFMVPPLYPDGKDFVIPEGVTCIAENAFKGNRSVETLTIPAWVNEIAAFDLDIIPTLKEIKLDPENKNFRIGENGELIGKNPNNGKDQVLFIPVAKNYKNFTVTAINELRYDIISYIKTEKFSLTEELKDSGYYTGEDGAIYHHSDNEDSLVAYPMLSKQTEYHIGKDLAANTGFNNLPVEKFTLDEDVPYVIDEQGALFNEGLGRLVAYPRNLIRKEFRIPDSCTFIDAACDVYPYLNVEKIIVGESNEKFSTDENGVLYNKEKTEILRYPPLNTNEEFTIPGTVKRVRDRAFEGVKNLKNITLNKDISDLSFLELIPSLQNIFTDTENSEYCSENGILYSADKETLLVYPSGREDASFTVPDTVKSISGQVSAPSLKEITIPAGVTRIDIPSVGYKVDCKKSEYYGSSYTIEKNPDIIIHCEKDSAAYVYALRHGFEADYPDRHEHIMSEWMPNGDGTHTRKCLDETCDFKETEECTFGDWEIKAPSCTEKGAKTRTCTVCGYTEKEEINATGHHFGEWEVVKEPSYFETGLRRRTCPDCQTTEEKTIPKLVADTEIKSGDNDVSLKSESGAVENGTELKVKEEAGSNASDIVNANKNGYANKVYDINLVKGDKKVQPSGKVLVGIPVPEGFSTDNLAVYHVTDNGLTKMKSVIKDGKVWFETDHFSSYALVDESSKVLMGDVDGSGDITASDARMILRASVNLETFNDRQKFVADYSGDKKITAEDARAVLRKSVNL